MTAIKCTVQNDVNEDTVANNKCDINKFSELHSADSFKLLVLADHNVSVAW